MDAMQTITARRSIRAYKADPVPKEILEKVLDTARFAPSGSNTQPWEFLVVSGKKFDEIKQALEEKLSSGEKKRPDVPIPDYPEKYLSRRKGLVRLMLEKMKITRADAKARLGWGVANIRFFDAPHAVIITVDRSIAPYALMDVGIVIQTLALAAHAHGLGTCIQAMVTTFPDVLRKSLDIPGTKLIALGMAVGYPDLNAPINTLERSREPLENFTTWHT
ncbi:nitroreductase [Elusimicrobiota bacterium]